MNSYNLFVLIELIVLIYYARSGRSGRKLIDGIILALPLLVLHSFADVNTITDAGSYFQDYLEVQKYSINSLIKEGGIDGVHSDLGWLLATKVLSYVFKDGQWVMAFAAIIIIGCYSYLFKKKSEIIWLSYFVFLFTFNSQSMFVLRQHSAIAICALSLIYVDKRKFIPYCLLILLASSFHLTALIFAPTYFLYNLDLSKQKIVLWIGVTIGLTYFVVNIVNSMFSHLILMQRFEIYSELTSSNMPFIIKIIEWGFISYFIKPLKLKGVFKVSYIMLCIAVSMELLSIFAPIGGRLTMYYSSSLFLLWPKCIQQAGKLKTPLLLFVIFYYLVLFYMGSSTMVFVEKLQMIF